MAGFDHKTIDAKWQAPARAEKAPGPAVDDAWVKAVAALCGLAVLPAALVDPGTGYCCRCRSRVPAQRS